MVSAASEELFRLLLRRSELENRPERPAGLLTARRTLDPTGITPSWLGLGLGLGLGLARVRARARARARAWARARARVRESYPFTLP